MNRIILIGNGFDLAHGLKTSYRHFIHTYWQERYAQLWDCKDCQLSDEFYQFLIKRNDDLVREMRLGNLIFKYFLEYRNQMSLEQLRSNKRIEVKSLEDIAELCDAVNDYHERTGFSEQIHYLKSNGTSELFTAINKVDSEKWIDIENEYYRILKKLHDTHSDSINEVTAEVLNADLNHIKQRLIRYLREIQENKITDEIANERIKEIISEPFNLQDISNDGLELFLNHIFFQVSNLPGGMSEGKIQEVMKSHPDYYVGNTEEEAHREMIKDRINKGGLDDFILPDRTLLLNFNYTNTAERLYVKSDERKDCELIYIHGELNNPANPIIFGYGDEMDEHYKKIVALNDNDYLQNIKSIRYLESDNYRKLLSFIDSAPYQIYIMGHSCGNSDRTLLNTLFEHKNCLSIKPYYYQDDDGHDNYIDIIQNIYRNFKDMTRMRDRVVNKGYCETMPQNETSMTR